VLHALPDASTREVPGRSSHRQQGHRQNQGRCQGQNRVHESLPGFSYRQWVEQWVWWRKLPFPA